MSRNHLPDIDLDLPTTFKVDDIFDQVIHASMVEKGELRKHPCGVYFQPIPVDQISGLAAIPYEPAEELGFFKVDFLHLTILDHFESKEEIRELLKHNPDWNLLQIPSVVQKLFQIHKHYDILAMVKPQTVQELADVIALIRPGKKHLLTQYLQNKEQVRKELYKRPKSGYYFKKGHAISYAMTIVLQLHLIKSKII